MATVTLGSIKFNWKGAYNSSTAYAVDDVVSSGGNSYVCIQAHTNQAVGNATAYWNIMSSKGTDADLMNITSTAQGDIYYNNGSAIARLGAGTSGQALITGGASANPSWGSAGGIKQVIYNHTTSNHSNGSSSYNDTNLTGTITPSSTSSKIAIFVSQSGHFANGNSNGTNRTNYLALFRTISGGSATEVSGQKQQNTFNVASQHMPIHFSFSHLDSPNTTSAITYKTMSKGDGGSWDIRLNYDGSRSEIMLMEVTV
jgi:hypothetical protein